MKSNYSYQITKFFLQALSNMIFRDITIIGEENIPLEGPLILSINHNSQYVDALLLFNLKRRLNFIVAGSSSRTTILGAILKTVGFIPTE